MIVFLSRVELYNLLASNMKYYRTFTREDKIARRISTISEYLEIIAANCAEFTEDARRKLEKCARMADQLLATISMVGFDGIKASKIKWKLGCMRGRQYEAGYPHTVKDAIILFETIVRRYTYKQLTRLLIHEKVHIYQRKYKKDVGKYIEANGFVVVGKIGENKKIRANPDIDDKVYYNYNTNKLYMATYGTTKPMSIGDVVNDDFEHPYEEMAYQISEKLI